MNDIFKAVPVTDDVYWVGAVDWNVRDFHGYETGRGTTYNAYLVMADAITLVDTVKAPFRGEMMSRISSVVDPAKIDYIISNHSEMDHSGSLPAVVEAIEPKKVFASAMGRKTLDAHFHWGTAAELSKAAELGKAAERGTADRGTVGRGTADRGAADRGRITAVADGETIDLGGMKITCYETRMLHWPDSMVSYLHEKRLLFSQDAFGMHLAASRLFDDEIAPSILEEEAAKYYANILMPFSNLVAKALERLAGLGVPFDIVAPDHGPVWRSKVPWILDRYRTWAKREPENKAVICYDTMWGSTDLMARAVADGLRGGGTEAKLLKLGSAHRSDVATELLDAGAFVVGSPTINNQIFPTVADVLTYVKGLKPKGLIGAAFGSYGWSGEAVREIEAALGEMKVELVAEGIAAQYVPREADLERCRALGESIAGRLAGAGAGSKAAR